MRDNARGAAKTSRSEWKRRRYWEGRWKACFEVFSLLFYGCKIWEKARMPLATFKSVYMKAFHMNILVADLVFAAAEAKFLELKAASGQGIPQKLELEVFKSPAESLSDPEVFTSHFLSSTPETPRNFASKSRTVTHRNSRS